MLYFVNYSVIFYFTSEFCIFFYKYINHIALYTHNTQLFSFKLDSMFIIVVYLCVTVNC